MCEVFTHVSRCDDQLTFDILDVAQVSVEQSLVWRAQKLGPHAHGGQAGPGHRSSTNHINCFRIAILIFDFRDLVEAKCHELHCGFIERTDRRGCWKKTECEREPK